MKRLPTMRGQTEIQHALARHQHPLGEMGREHIRHQRNRNARSPLNQFALPRIERLSQCKRGRLYVSGRRSPVAQCNHLLNVSQAPSALGLRHGSRDRSFDRAAAQLRASPASARASISHPIPACRKSFSISGSSVPSRATASVLRAWSSRRYLSIK